MTILEILIVRVVCLLPLVVVFGCYSYMPIAPASASPGTEIRAHITGAASDRVGPLLGSLEMRELNGRVLENDNGQMVADIELGTRPNVVASTGVMHRQVPLTPADFTSIESRNLDATRTALLVGGILAGVGVGVAAALHSGGHSEDGRGPPEPPPIVRIPVRRWGISF
jgi:hypothetical protein